MSSFLDQLHIHPVEGTDNTWELDSPFRYWIDELHNGPVIEIPKAFQTDFASIPKLFWNILPPWGKYGKAAVVHDYLYKTGIYSKDRADEIFLDAMTILGVNRSTRYIMYYAVKYFGKSAWNKHRKEDNTKLLNLMSIKHERY